MAIQIKEWGMLSYPGRGVQVPLQGIAGMDESAARLGRVIEGAAQLGAQLAEQQETVTTAGNLAEFAGRLRQVEDEARAEIDMQNVRDWKYAWNQATEARLAEAVDELPRESRAAGRHLAAVYSAQASATAKRDYELGRIGLARHRWQARVDEAVERGDAEEAERWLRAGEGLFVPTDEVEDRSKKARSKSVLNQWKAAFLQNAPETLAALQREDARLPQEPADREALLAIRESQFRAVSREVAEEMSRAAEQGQQPPATVLQKAAAAGVLTPQQAESAGRFVELSGQVPAAVWNLRVDECPDDEDAEMRLKLDILSAAVPTAAKRTLLQRLRRNREVPVSARGGISRRLWNLYLSGSFGCPEDAEACHHLARLQAQVPELLRRGNARETERWLERVSPNEETWICYQPN